MTDSILQFLNSHGSVRQFTGREISGEDERTILTTAERSPTSSNLHAYSIITVRGQKNKDLLAGLAGGQAHVAKSSLFLIFCADLYRLSLLNRKRGYRFNGQYTQMFVIATVDAALAACRALMAAQALGIGGVMVGGIRNNPEEVCKLVGLPELVYPVMGMSLGYPVKPPVVKPRLPLEAISFSETYNAGAIERAVEAYDRTIDELGYLKGREVNKEAYPDFAGSYSWSEHSARRMADGTPSTLRPHMKAFLQKRGFLVL